MKINTIKLENIGPFENKIQNFPMGISCIIGSNGSGKTTMLESIPLVLFGTTPSRTGSLYDRITKGHKGNASAAISFEVNGQSYTAMTIANANRKTPVSEYYLYEGTDEEPICGPKLSEYKDKIESLLGSPSLFFASVFSSQKDYGDICSAKPSERKDIFSQMLSLGLYNNIKDRIDERLDLLNEQLLPKRADMHARENYIEILDDDISKINIDILKDDLLMKRTDYDKYLESIKSQADNLAKLKSDISNYNIASKNRRDLLDRLKQVAIDRAMLGKHKPSTIHTRSDVDRIQTVIDEERKQLVIMETNREKYIAATRKKDNLEAVISACKSNIENTKRKLSILNEIPNEACCQQCKFTQDARSAMPLQSELLKQLYVAQKDYDEIEIPVFNEEEYRLLQATINDRIAEQNKIREIVDNISKSINEYNNKIAVIDANERSIYQQIDDNAKILSSSNIEDMEALYNKASIESNDITVKMKACQQLIESYSKQINSYEEMVERRDELKTHIFTDIIEVNKLETDAHIYEILLKAFGKNGITQLVIDSAASQFESIANELLQIATNGSMSINFATQRTLKDGSTAEALDIIVHHKGLSYDVSEYSGGEQKLIKTIIHLTLSMYMAGKSNNKLRSLFIDEIFDDLDADNSQRILNVLNYLQSYFDQIIVISHSDDLLMQMPNIIKL